MKQASFLNPLPPSADVQPYADRLEPADMDFLRRTLGEDLLVTAEELHVYASDASLKTGRPLAAARPRRVEQVQDLLAWAQDRRMPVYVRGRGTNLVGDCVPVLPGLVISTLLMDSIEEISATDFVAVVEPGLTTGRLQDACEARGLYYPPDPATVRSSSIGGNVITCAGGMRALKYGVTRDFVLGMDVVLPGGRRMHFGGRTHKNVVGLDVARLMVGSEGTLGFISKLWLKLLPRPEASATIMAGYGSHAEALGAVGEIFAAGIVPCALEYIGDGIIDLMAGSRPVPWPREVRSILLIRLDGSADTLPLEAQRLLRSMSTALWHTTGLTPQDEERLWEIRRRINPTTFLAGPDKMADDVTVPRGQLVRALAEMENIAREHNVTFLHFGHVGDGNIHANILYDAADRNMARRVEEARLGMEQAVLRLGGVMSGEHGCGICKDAGLQIPPAERALMHEIKAVFDPRNIMNPGKGY